MSNTQQPIPQDQGQNDSFFEPIKHAYARIFLYFALFGVISLGMGVWAYIILAPHWKSHLCGDLVFFFQAFGGLCFFQFLVHILLSVSLYNFRGCCCHLTTVVMVIAYIAVALAEAGALTLGILFVWGSSSSAKICKSQESSFFNQANIYIYVAIGVYGIQAIFGTLWLIYYGLCTATREASHNLVSSEETAPLAP